MGNKPPVLSPLNVVISAKAGIHHRQPAFNRQVMDQLQVGLSPGQSLNMRGMFNLPLLRGNDEWG
jgi:hypothetical protein